MKTAALAVVLSLTVASAARAQQPPMARDDLDNVYETLAPYGVWIDLAPWGRIWKPSTPAVGTLFYPYLTRGHWAHTSNGWTWASEFEWGWLPFHYGRWILAANYGWCWVPGEEWAPAWVSWRVGDRYIGWVPLPPDVEGAALQAPAWCFVPRTGFLQRDLTGSRVPFDREREVYLATATAGYENDDPRRGPDPRRIGAP